jgi:hypothetical protein
LVPDSRWSRFAQGRWGGHQRFRSWLDVVTVAQDRCGWHEGLGS